MGEHIVVVARQFGRGRSSGAPVSGKIVHAWHLRDGRVLDMRAFSDADQALAALGRTPEGFDARPADSGWSAS